MVLLAPGYSLSRLGTQRGFTIVELLIVIVVIAILAAITIVSYNGITNRAIQTSLQSDLRNAQKTIQLAELEGDIPTDSSAFKASNGAVYQYTYDNSTSPKAYCLTATIKATSFYISTAGNPTPGACPGHINGIAPPTLAWATTAAGSGQWWSAAISDNGQKIVAAPYASGFISSSLDGGATWTTNGNSSGTTAWYAVAGTPDGSTYFALNSQGAVRKSTNDGVTWTQVAANIGAARITNTLSVSSNGNTVAALRSNGVSVSLNSGSTWASPVAIPGGTITDMALSDDGNYLYVTSSDGNVYKNVYSGSAWSGWSSLPNMAIQATAGASMIDTSADGSKIYAISPTIFKASSDYGATGVTKTFPTNSAKGDLKVSADGTRLIGRDSSGFIYTSINSGDTWTTHNTGPMIDTAWGAVGVSSNGAYMVAGISNGTFMKGSF